MDMVHPEQEDDEATLLAKAYLLWGIANTLPESRNFTAQKVAEVQNLIFSEEH